MSETAYRVHAASSRYASPWSVGQRLAQFLWTIVWPLFCAWTPKPLNGWRLMWLRIFGCKVSGMPFVHQRARIQIPWHITLHDRACIGDRANLYSLAEIELGCRCVIGQEAYLCTGTHDFSHPDIPLATAKIAIDADAFVGARAFIMPGVRVGERAIVGACSVVTHDVQTSTVVAGNPSKVIRAPSTQAEFPASLC